MTEIEKIENWLGGIQARVAQAKLSGAQNSAQLETISKLIRIVEYELNLHREISGNFEKLVDVNSAAELSRYLVAFNYAAHKALRAAIKEIE
jgi:capsule polysaccharide export protein KpsE/RkpR